MPASGRKVFTMPMDLVKSTVVLEASLREGLGSLEIYPRELLLQPSPLLHHVSFESHNNSGDRSGYIVLSSYQVPGTLLHDMEETGSPPVTRELHSLVPPGSEVVELSSEMNFLGIAQEGGMWEKLYWHGVTCPGFHRPLPPKPVLEKVPLGFPQSQKQGREPFHSFPLK
jgi:hypothetical protein